MLHISGDFDDNDNCVSPENQVRCNFVCNFSIISCIKERFFCDFVFKAWASISFKKTQWKILTYNFTDPNIDICETFVVTFDIVSCSS